MIGGLEGSEIYENRGLDGSKILKNLGLKTLGEAWGAFCRSLERFGENFCKSWHHDGTKMGEVGAKFAPRWTMLVLRWRLGAQLGRF